MTPVHTTQPIAQSSLMILGKSKTLKPSEFLLHTVKKGQPDYFKFKKSHKCTDFTNSILSLGKTSKNNIHQPNNYKKVFACVWKKQKKYK